MLARLFILGLRNKLLQVRTRMKPFAADNNRGTCQKSEASSQPEERAIPSRQADMESCTETPTLYCLT